MAQLRREQSNIEARGARLVVVGQGQPPMAQDFVEERDLTFPVLVDPEMRAYRAAGLRRGVRTSVNRRTLGHAVRAMRQGHAQGKTQGDPWQQGGVFVFGPGNREHYAYVSREAGDHPPLTEVLDAVPGSS